MRPRSVARSVNGLTIADLAPCVVLCWKEESVLSGEKSSGLPGNKNDEQSLWEGPSLTQKFPGFPDVCFALSSLFHLYYSSPHSRNLTFWYSRFWNCVCQTYTAKNYFAEFYSVLYTCIVVSPLAMKANL